MNPWDANSETLARHHPAAFAALGADPGDPGRQERASVRIAPTPSGDPTLIVDGVHYHSRYNPRRDAAAAVEREVDAAATAILVVGFGLGYTAEEAGRRYPGLPLVIVEPDRSVFRAALSCRDLTAFLSRDNLSLYVAESPDGLPRVLEGLPLARPAFLRLRPAYRHDPAAYRAAEETVQSWLLRREINTNTLSRFGRLWVRNLCRNLPVLADSPGIGALAGLFDGLPALLVAGGPTLDATLPLLPRLRERLLVISVNTPVRACRSAGVEPDFVVVVDPQYWASRYLDWAVPTSGVVVAEPSTCPRVFRGGSAPLFFCSSLFPLGEALEDAIGARGRLGAGGSVATAAWDFARILGCGPLYAAGLDLGFPGMRTHCRGVFAEESWTASANRLDPVEGSSWRSLREIGLFTVRSASGGSTPTDRRMLLYKWWFENQLKAPGSVEGYTLSGAGAAIEGMRVTDPRDLLSLPIRRPAIDETMRQVRALHERRAPFGRAAAALRAAVDRVITGLGELEVLARRGTEGTTGLSEAIARGAPIAEALAALDAIDRRILGVSERSVAGFLIQGLIHRIEGEGGAAASPPGDRSAAAAVAARSAEMYEGIAESAAWQARLLRRAADDLDRGDRLS